MGDYNNRYGGGSGGGRGRFGGGGGPMRGGFRNSWGGGRYWEFEIFISFQQFKINVLAPL